MYLHRKTSSDSFTKETRDPFPTQKRKSTPIYKSLVPKADKSMIREIYKSVSLMNIDGKIPNKTVAN